MWVSDNLVNNPQIIFGCLCPTFVCHYCRRAHTGKQVCKSLCLLKPPQTIQSCFGMGFGLTFFISSSLSEPLPIGSWAISCLLMSEMLLPDMMSFRMCMLSRALMLDLQLQPSTVEHHLAHPSLSGAQKLLLSCETRRHILSQSQSHKSDMATKSVAKNDDVCGFNLEQGNP